MLMKLLHLETKVILARFCKILVMMAQGFSSYGLFGGMWELDCPLWFPVYWPAETNQTYLHLITFKTTVAFHHFQKNKKRSKMLQNLIKHRTVNAATSCHLPHGWSLLHHLWAKLLLLFFSLLPSHFPACHTLSLSLPSNIFPHTRNYACISIFYVIYQFASPAFGRVCLHFPSCWCRVMSLFAAAVVHLCLMAVVI